MHKIISDAIGRWQAFLFFFILIASVFFAPHKLPGSVAIFSTDAGV